MSSGNNYTGPWNEGKTTQLGETIQYIEDPVAHVLETNGLLQHEAAGTDRTEKAVQHINQQTSKIKSAEVKAATPAGVQQWNTTLEDDPNETENTKDVPK